MQINIQNTTSNETISSILCHDINGNVFLKINETYHGCSIDGNNNLEFSEYDISKFSESNQIDYDIIMDSDGNTLKKKILDKIENDEDSDNEEDYQNYRDKIKCLKEDKYYCILDKNYDEEIEMEKDRGEFYEYDGDNFEYFKFYKTSKDKSILLLNKYFDCISIYDTFVRDENKNVTTSLINNSHNSYRLSFFRDNTIELNIIGDCIKTYTLKYCYDNNGIINIQALLK